MTGLNSTNGYARLPFQGILNFALCLLAALAVCSPHLHAQTAAVDGNTVRMVDMGDGAFVKTGPQVWASVAKENGQIVNRYREIGRPDPNYAGFIFKQGVILFEPKGEIGLRLDLSRRKIQLSPKWPDQKFTDFRDIVNVSNQSRIPGIDRDWWQNEPLSVVQTFNGVFAENLRMVDLGYAAFVKISSQQHEGWPQWVEVDKASGAVRFTFDDRTGLYLKSMGIYELHDSSRNIGLKFKMGPMKAEIRHPGSQNWDSYWNIEAISDQSRIPGIDRDWTGFQPAQAAAPSGQPGSNPAQASQGAPQTGAPPGKAQLTWKFQNTTGEVLYVRLRSDSTIWPGNFGSLAYESDGRVYSYVMNCTPKETICYGAWLGDSRRSYGLGENLDRSLSCKTCCQTCRSGMTNVISFGGG